MTNWEKPQTDTKLRQSNLLLGNELEAISNRLEDEQGFSEGSRQRFWDKISDLDDQVTIARSRQVPVASVESS